MARLGMHVAASPGQLTSVAHLLPQHIKHLDLGSEWHQITGSNNDQLSWLPPGVLMLQPPRSAAGQEEGQTAESQLSSASLKTPEVFRTFLQRAFLPHWSEQGHTAALATRRGCRIHLLCSLCIGKQQGKGTGDWRTQCSVSHRAGTQLARQWAGFPGTRSWAGTGLLR